MVAIDGVSFDWSYMAKDEVPTNMAPMAFSDTEVYTNNTCSKTCLKSYETLKKQYDDLRIDFNKSEFNLVTYKRGLTSVEEQLVIYKKNKVIFYEQIDLLKRDLSYRDSKRMRLYFISNELKESPDAPSVKDKVSDNKDCSVESLVMVEKKTVVLTVTKIEFVKAKQQEQPVRKPIKYAEMYRLQGLKGNQRNWNNLKSQQLGSNFVMYNKACFVCGSFKHMQANCNYHQRERVEHGSKSSLMKTGLRLLNTARPVNTAHPKTTVHYAKQMPRSVTTAMPRPVNTVRPRPVNTARPNSLVINAVRANQFWQSATTRTLDNGEMKITAIIDRKVKVVTKASVRRHLKLEDSE
nr:ubiquitin hydrolase [Tanacetum cinerariifolium]